MARTYSLDNRVWAANGEKTDPDTVTTSEANLLTVANGHIDSQGPFSDIMNWEQHRVSQMVNAMEQMGLLEWSSKTNYGQGGFCQDASGQIYQSRKPNNKSHVLSDKNWWTEYIPTGMGDMLASVYDKNGNGFVDVAEKVNGIDGSGNNTYYGKNASGVVGFHAVPPDGDMKKSAYDSNNNGRVDNADQVFGVDSAGPSKYYGTNQNGTVGYYNLPANGDMLKSVYDTNNNGRVDIADAVFGVDTAESLTYYGKNKDGNVGFYKVLDILPEYAKRWPTPAEIGALRADEDADNSLKLGGLLPATNATANTIAQRDPSGDIQARLFRSNYATVSSLADSADICFRNDTTDNYMRFVDKAGFKKWLKLTKSDVALNNVQNYGISHVASQSANSKSKYASEYAVGVAWKLAKQAYDATLVGGKVDSALTADKLSIPRVIALGGDVVGSVNFDGSQNVSMTVSVSDNSHKHTWANITGEPVYTQRWPKFSEVKDRPSTYPPSAHQHSWNDIQNKPNVAVQGLTPAFSSANLGGGDVDSVLNMHSRSSGANTVYASFNDSQKGVRWGYYGFSADKDNTWKFVNERGGSFDFTGKALKENGHRVYTTGNKPSPGDLNVWSKDESNDKFAPKHLWRDNYTNILVEGDADTYYPVIIPSMANDFAWKRVSISRGYGWTAPDSWNNKTHKGGLTLAFRWSGDHAWGGNSHNIVFDEFKETYSTMVGGYAYTKAGILVWLRGGRATYRIHSDYGPLNVAIKLTDWKDIDGVIYSPTAQADPELKKRRGYVLSRYNLRDGGVYDNDERVYSKANKPTAADIDALGVNDKAKSAITADAVGGIKSSQIVYGSNGFACNRMTDFNVNRKSGFIEMDAALSLNKPGRSDSWVWGFQTCHAGNSSTGRYGAQIIINQDSQIYFRVQNWKGEGAWRQPYHEGHKPTAKDVGALPVGQRASANQDGTIRARFVDISGDLYITNNGIDA